MTPERRLPSGSKSASRFTHRPQRVDTGNSLSRNERPVSIPLPPRAKVARQSRGEFKFVRCSPQPAATPRLSTFSSVKPLACSFTKASTMAGASVPVGRSGWPGRDPCHPCPWLCQGLLQRVRVRLPGGFLLPRPGGMPVVQRPAYGGDHGASLRSRTAAVAAAAVGVVRTQAAALLPARRCGAARRGRAHLAARGRALPARTQSRQQRRRLPRRRGVHPPLRLGA